MEPRTKFSCKNCSVRVAVGVQCATCDFWFHATPKCAGATANLGVPPFICEICLAQITVPKITHFAALSSSGSFRELVSAVGITPTPRGGRARLAFLEGSGGIPEDGRTSSRSPLATAHELRSFRRNSLLMSARLTKAPLPVPHISGANVVFDDSSQSTSSSDDAADALPHANRAAGGGDGVDGPDRGGEGGHAGDGCGSPRVDKNVGHTYHSAFAPMLKPVARTRAKIAAADVLHLIAPEEQLEGEGLDLVAIGAANARGGVAAAFEEARLDLQSLRPIKTDVGGSDSEAEGDADGESHAPAAQGNPASAAAGQLVEDFNISAFGYQQGSKETAAALQRAKMLQQKQREKRIAAKRRVAAAAAVTMTGAEARAHARSTKQVMMEHRKLYYSNIPQALPAPWLLPGYRGPDNDSGDDEALMENAASVAHLSLMQVPSGIPPSLTNRVPSSSGISGAANARPGLDALDSRQPRRHLDPEKGTKGLFARSSTGLRLSTVEEVVRGFRDSSEEDILDPPAKDANIMTMSSGVVPSRESHSPDSLEMGHGSLPF